MTHLNGRVRLQPTQVISDIEGQNQSRQALRLDKVLLQLYSQTRQVPLNS